jgi:transposase
MRWARRIYDHRPRAWRHPDLGSMETTLVYDLPRVVCRRCGVRSELVPWAEPGSRFTRDFEDQVAYLAQVTDQTTVSTTMRIAWKTVGQIIERVIARLGPADRPSATSPSPSPGPPASAAPRTISSTAA